MTPVSGDVWVCERGCNACNVDLHDSMSVPPLTRVYCTCFKSSICVGCVCVCVCTNCALVHCLGESYGDVHMWCSNSLYWMLYDMKKNVHVLKVSMGVSQIHMYCTSE